MNIIQKLEQQIADHKAALAEATPREMRLAQVLHAVGTGRMRSEPSADLNVPYTGTEDWDGTPAPLYLSLARVMMGQWQGTFMRLIEEDEEDRR